MNTAPELVTQKLLSVDNVCKSFPKQDGGELVVLDGVNLTLVAGQIVGLLGRSGSGKSTLLRLIAGLSEPSAGTLAFRGEPIAGCASGIAMVFQSFALFPWLTVFENVALGLEAQHMEKAAIRKRSLAAIDLIGLDGFESAYPRELSGGMRQRVGFARALVVHPDILLMDEPFSALDVLTAETLRTDFLDLWAEGQMPIKGVILVTHNIEEAVLMCDRVLVFGSNPGRILSEIDVTLPQPRKRLDPKFRELVEKIYVEMTSRRSGAVSNARTERFPGLGIGTVLPRVSSNLRTAVQRHRRSAEDRLRPADGNRRVISGRRNAADDALRRSRGRRHQAHARRHGFRQRRTQCAQADLRPSPAQLRAARGPHPSGAR